AGFIYSWLPQMIVQRVFIAYNTNRLSIVLIMIIMSFISIFIGALYFIFVTNGDIIITLKSFLLSFGIVEIIKVFIVMMIVNKLPKRYLT
ncbi:MAG: hypothetical protein RR577_00890, partial [Erysipelotrichales bacterium]